MTYSASWFTAYPVSKLLNEFWRFPVFRMVFGFQFSLFERRKIVGLSGPVSDTSTYKPRSKYESQPERHEPGHLTFWSHLLLSVPVLPSKRLHPDSYTHRYFLPVPSPRHQARCIMRFDVITVDSQRMTTTAQNHIHTSPQEWADAIGDFTQCKVSM